MTVPSLRALILEDEWVARNFLVELVEGTGLASVVGAVAHLDEAVSLLDEDRHAHVDVVFVDVQLVGSQGDGFSLIEAWVKRPRAPRFVLATADKAHALRAFDLGVLDYLTKPFTSERVRRCLERVASVTSRDVEHSVPSRIVARKKRSLVFLALDDIWAFESSDRITLVHSPHGAFDIDLSLNAIEASFGRQFKRTHRNWLVNALHIRELERDAGESNLFVGSGYGEPRAGVSVPVARDRSQALREWLLSSAPGIRRR